MVYKTNKHGVRTGNTVKRWNTKYFRNYTRHSYLVRSHINNDSGLEGAGLADAVRFGKASALEEGDSMTDGVEYSLNKQARWELPEILEGKILSQNHEEDYGIELLERHRINRAANCINVCSTSGIYKNGKINKDRRFTRKDRGGYCHPSSVLEKSKKNKKNRRRRRALQAEPSECDDEPEIKNENKLRYEVFHPVPTASYLCHIDKAIGMGTTKDHTRNGGQGKQQRQRKVQSINNHIQESLSCMDDSFCDSEEEIFHTEADDVLDDSNELNYQVTLDDILLHANTANRLVTFKRRHHSDGSVSSAEMASAKCHVVYIDEEEESTERKVSEGISKTVLSTLLEPVHVILADEMVTPQMLADTYRKRYIECECFPRKFILNISDRVNKLNCFKSLSKSSYNLAEVCLVFVHDIDNEINNHKENVYKLFLNANMNGNISSISIETIFEYMETNVEELIERSLFFIETLPEEYVVSKIDSKSNKTNLRQTPSEQNAKSTNAYKPDNDFLFDYYVSNSQDVLEELEMGYEIVPRFNSTIDDTSDNIASPKDRLCCICYSSIEDSVPGTALIACSHWFCDPCWKEYLRTKIVGGALSLKCPEFDCDMSVDPGTVLSLINYRDVIKHARHCHDTEVERQPSTKWCPNEFCGRVVKINNTSSRSKNCECSCGLKMCFDCLEPPHWPASCESANKYYKKLRNSGDMYVGLPSRKPPIVIRAKPCPSCHRSIEKIGGCPNMVCACQANFCWGCGELWHTRVHGEGCYKHGYKNAHGTVSTTFAQNTLADNKTRQKWYKMALIHRVNQHPGNIRTLKIAVKPLSRKIQGYVFNTEKSGKPVTLNFDIPGRTFDRECEKAQHLVNNTIDLYSEINHVIENIAVLLFSEQLSQMNRAVLKRILQRLACFSEALYEVFDHHESFRGKVVVDKFTEVRFHSEKTMQSLIRCIKSMAL